MSTAGLIAIMNEDGSCRSIYCHYDMYPSDAGTVLMKHYQSSEAVEELLALGDLSSLGSTRAQCEAYHRDRGEELNEPTKWADRWILARKASDYFGVNYVYLFMDGEWLCSDGGGWTPVADRPE